MTSKPSAPLKDWRSLGAFRCLRPTIRDAVLGELLYVDATQEPPFFMAGDVLLLPAKACLIEVRTFAELLTAGAARGVNRWDFARAAEIMAAEVFDFGRTVRRGD